jgi:hypothetical protein
MVQMQCRNSFRFTRELPGINCISLMSWPSITLVARAILFLQIILGHDIVLSLRLESVSKTGNE